MRINLGFWRLILVTGLAVSCSACGACAPTVVPLAIKVHTTAVLTATDAALIAKGAETVLRNADSSGDVACNMAFPIDSFGSFTTGTGIVLTKFAYNSLFDPTPFTPPDPQAPVSPIRQVRVVSDIRWCGALIPGLLGCADLPGNRIALVRGTDNEHELWAHELGHAKGGLSDRSDSWLAVMFPTILPDHRVVNSSECSAYRL